MTILTKPTSVTEWAESGDNVLEPGAAKKNTGFIVEKPAYQTINWIYNNLTQWERYTESYLDEITNTGIILDTVEKTLKMDDGYILIEREDTETDLSSANKSKISIKNKHNTAGNYSAVEFKNQNDEVTAKLAAVYRDHSTGETDLSFCATTSAGILTPYLNIRGDSGYTTFDFASGFTIGDLDGADRLSLNAGTFEFKNSSNILSPIRAELVTASVVGSSIQLVLNRSGTAAGSSALGGASGDFRVFTSYDVDPLEVMRINTSGSVGVGTVTPNEKMEVSGDGHVNIKVTSSTHSAGVAHSAGFKLAYTHSGGLAEGYVILSENGLNAFDGTVIIGAPYNNGGGSSTSRSTVYVNGSGKTGFGESSPDTTIHASLNGGSNILKLERTGTNAGAVVIGGADGDFRVNVDADGANIEAIRINENGQLGIGVDPSSRLHVQGAEDATLSFIHATNASYTGTSHIVQTTKSNNSDFYLCKMNTGAGSDTEFGFKGDGNGLCDGSWSGGGADYAEYFESKSGGSLEPGVTVTLDEGKVRPALEGDTPIGVVRPLGTSSIIGNNQWNNWRYKYLKDDFGAYKKDLVKKVKWIEPVYKEELSPKTEMVKMQKTVTKLIDGKYTEVEESCDIEKRLTIEHKIFDKNGDPVMVEELVFDKNGDPVMVDELVFDKNGDPVMVDELVFDKNQKIVMEKKLKNGVTYIFKKSKKVQLTRLAQSKKLVNKTYTEELTELRKIKTGEKDVCYSVSELGDLTPPENAEYFESYDRVLNPKYDPNKKYIPYEDREDKILVGLLGQIQIKNGQNIKDSWIKMSDVNKNLSLYYVR